MKLFTSLMSQNIIFQNMFEQMDGYELLGMILKMKEKENEIDASVVNLLFRLAANLGPDGEDLNIENIIEDNPARLPLCQPEKVKFLEIAIDILKESSSTENKS